MMEQVMDTSGLWSEWWLWAAFGIGLVIFEIFAPGFVFLGFAVGAAVVAILALLGLTPSLPWMLVIFGCVSIAAWLGMRSVIGVRTGQTKHFDSDINEN